MTFMILAFLVTELVKAGETLKHRRDEDRWRRILLTPSDRGPA